MIIEKDVLKLIKQQIALCMKSYGDNPEKLLYKLEQLILEWFMKGLNKDVKQCKIKNVQ